MPTILQIKGWRIFFYTNERNEPIHVHCKKADKECKYWLNTSDFDIEEAFAYNMTGRDRREIRQIIFEHYELIEKEWQKNTLEKK
jgi:RecB family endonuclease NucS